MLSKQFVIPRIKYRSEELIHQNAGDSSVFLLLFRNFICQSAGVGNDSLVPRRQIQVYSDIKYPVLRFTAPSGGRLRQCGSRGDIIVSPDVYNWLKKRSNRSYGSDVLKIPTHPSGCSRIIWIHLLNLLYASIKIFLYNILQGHIHPALKYIFNRNRFVHLLSLHFIHKALSDNRFHLPYIIIPL